MHVPRPIVKSGFFFTPKNQGERLPGTLSITDGGLIELEVTASGTSSFAQYGEMEIGRLIGEIEGGYVTLEDCSYIKKSFALGGGTGKSTIIADCAFVGRPMEEPEQFEALRFGVDSLQEWLCRSTFTAKVGADFFDYAIALKKPVAIECTLPDETHLKIDFEVKVPFQINAPKLELHQNPYIQITPLNPQPIGFYQKLSHRITRFFSFLIGGPVAIKDLKIKANDADAIGPNQWPELYFRSLNEISKLPKNSREILLPFPQVEHKFANLISNWLNDWENLEPALHHYFTVQAGTNRYADTSFISMAQALEAFHRRTCNDSTLWPKSVYKSKVKAILEGCPEDDREWLKQKLNFGNEIPLAARIRHLITPFSDIFGTEKSIQAMIRGLVKTRNYHAHYDAAGKKSALVGAPLLALTFRMRVLFVLCLLVRLGFSVKEANDVTKKEQISRLLLTASAFDGNADP